MSKSIELREKRAALWEQTKDFLSKHENENGLLSAEDTATYERMEKDITDMGAAIERAERADAMEREMNAQVGNTLVGRPQTRITQEKVGTGSKTYNDAFWLDVRGRGMTYEMRDALQVGELSEGGYTCPDEFDRQLVEKLDEENIMRGLVHKIKTDSGDRKIPLVVDKGVASWVEEENEIPESDIVFGQITLGAHKLGRMIKISRELLHDSAFNLANYIATDFGRSVGKAEEAAIINGDGSHKPYGLLHDTYGAEIGVNAASATAITADELMDLQHSLATGYRRNAVWIMNDATVKLLRKLKDGNGNFIWQPGLTAGAPDMLLGQRVLTTHAMPLAEAGSKAIMYGDYSYYYLAEREGRSMQRLNELYAKNDQIGFKITERLDGRLILPEAVKVLKMKA